MASSFTNDCESPTGLEGVPVTTTSSSPESDQWSSVTVDPGYEVVYVYRNYSGSTGFDARPLSVGDGRAFVTWTGFSPTTATKLTSRFYLFFNVANASGVFFSAQGPGGVRVLDLAFNGDWRLVATDQAGNSIEAADQVSTGRWYRLDVVIDLTVPLITVTVTDADIWDPETTPGLSVQITPELVGGTLSPVDRVSYGKITPSYMDHFVLDEIALDTESVDPPDPPGGGAEAHYDITTNYLADSSTRESWLVDTTDSVGTTTLVQTGGPTATITESPTGMFTVSNPAAAGNIIMLLTATSGGSITKTVRITRSSGVATEEKAYRMAFQGGGAATDIGNWD